MSTTQSLLQLFPELKDMSEYRLEELAKLVHPKKVQQKLEFRSLKKEFLTGMKKSIEKMLDNCD